MIRLQGYAQWTKLNSDIITTLASIHLLNKNIGFVVGEYGLISMSKDGGKTWDKEYYRHNYNSFNNVYFINDSNGYIVGNYGVIFKTINSGIDWFIFGYYDNWINNYNAHLIAEHLWSMTFVNDSVGFIATANGYF